MKLTLTLALIGIAGLVVLIHLPEQSTQTPAPVVHGSDYNTVSDKPVPKPEITFRNETGEVVPPEKVDTIRPWNVLRVAAIFEDNEIQGEQMFRGVTLIEGTIDGIETGFIDGAHLEFAGGGGFLSPVQCSIEQENVWRLANVHKGQRIHMLGHNPRRYLGTVVFSDCVPTNLGWATPTPESEPTSAPAPAIPTRLMTIVNDDNNIVEMSQVSPPRATVAPDPGYTDQARTDRIQGTCVLEFVVGTDGRARDIRVKRYLGGGLDENAMATLQQWQFEPATKDGKAVAVKLTTEMDFRLF